MSPNDCGEKATIAKRAELHVGMPVRVVYDPYPRSGIRPVL